MATRDEYVAEVGDAHEAELFEVACRNNMGHLAPSEPSAYYDWLLVEWHSYLYGDPEPTTH